MGVTVRLSLGYDGTVLMLTMQQCFLKVHYLKITPNSPVTYSFHFCHHKKINIVTLDLENTVD